MIFRFFTSSIYMRSRILAIIILIIFLVIPILLYWFFTTQKISSVTITVSWASQFLVKIDGTFGLDGLPLADSVLTYEKECIEICEITPVLPAIYQIVMSASWKSLIEDSIILNAGEKVTRQYVMHDDFSFTKVTTLPSSNLETDSSLYNSGNIVTIIPVGVDIDGKIWARRSVESISQLGIFSSWQFTPVQNLASPIRDIVLDTSHSVLVAKIGTSDYVFFPVDGSSQKQVSFDRDITITGVVPGKNWSFRTQTGSWSLVWTRLIEDIRFTDSIDISPSIRLGYISRDDNQKLSLGNFPTGESLLIRLDRTTGESSIVRRWTDISMFFYYKNMPAYTDWQGNIYTIEGK